MSISIRMVNGKYFDGIKEFHMITSKKIKIYIKNALSLSVGFSSGYEVERCGSHSYFLIICSSIDDGFWIIHEHSNINLAS
jgi:hypothetical protein